MVLVLAACAEHQVTPHSHTLSSKDSTVPLAFDKDKNTVIGVGGRRGAVSASSPVIVVHPSCPNDVRINGYLVRYLGKRDSRHCKLPPCLHSQLRSWESGPSPQTVLQGSKELEAQYLSC